MIDSLNLYLKRNKFSPSVLRKMDVIYVDFQFTVASVLLKGGSEVPRSLLYQTFCLHNGGKIQHMAVLFNQSHGAAAKSVHSQSGYTSWHSVMTYIPKKKKMLHKLMWENFYYWICIFLVFTPTVVQTLSKCSKVDVCKCSTDEGTIDLWSLDGTSTGSNIPRFGYDLGPVNSRLGSKETSHPKSLGKISNLMT